MHPRRLLLLCVASNSKNKYWGYKLACIRAHVELSNTFVYDYEMSVGTNGTVMIPIFAKPVCPGA